MPLALLASLRCAARSFWQRWRWLWEHDAADASPSKDSDDTW